MAPIWRIYATCSHRSWRMWSWWKSSIQLNEIIPCTSFQIILKRKHVSSKPTTLEVGQCLIIFTLSIPNLLFYSHSACHKFQSGFYNSSFKSVWHSNLLCLSRPWWKKRGGMRFHVVLNSHCSQWIICNKQICGYVCTYLSICFIHVHDVWFFVDSGEFTVSRVYMYVYIGMDHGYHMHTFNPHRCDLIPTSRTREPVPWKELRRENFGPTGNH